MKDIKKYFSTNDDYKKFLIAKSYAEKINDFIDKSYIVFDETNLIKDKFVFEDFDKKPTIGILTVSNDNCHRTLYCYFCSTYDSDEKIIIEEENKEQIFNKFAKFRFINPKNIELFKEE
jgi:hypothetical protein